jgi:hypothetical protein
MLLSELISNTGISKNFGELEVGRQVSKDLNEYAGGFRLGFMQDLHRSTGAERSPIISFPEIHECVPPDKPVLTRPCVSQPSDSSLDPKVVMLAAGVVFGIILAFLLGGFFANTIQINLSNSYTQCCTG